MNLDLQQAIKDRRSIRKYQSKDVPEELLSRIIEAGRQAPYAAERWLVIIVKDTKTKKAMLEDFNAEYRNLHVPSAPVNLVVCSDLRKQNLPPLAKKYHGKDDSWLVFSIQEIGAMIQNMLLTAHENGLGACWNGTFSDRRVAEVLNLPDGIRPMAIISLGYPAETPEQRKRKSLEQIVHRERFG